MQVGSIPKSKWQVTLVGESYMRMKFYFAQFKHNRSNKLLSKFGITKHMNAIKRFSKSESIKYGNDPNQYADFTIKILASIPCKSGKEAHALEKKFLEHFNKKPHVESYFGIKKAKYQKMSGITELRQLTYKQVGECFDMILAATPKHVLAKKKMWSNFYKKARENNENSKNNN